MMKISIIIPIYHVEHYLTMCLDSVAHQTMTEGIECILVDDCGKDRSLEIAKNYVANYQGKIYFRIIEREQNGGLSAARNTGIEVATGEYLYFLDSDDEITLSCMERMWGKVEQYGKVDLVQGAFYEDTKEAEMMSSIKFSDYSQDKRQIKSFLLQYLGDIVGAQSRLIKTSFLKDNKLFFEEGIIHEDNYWTFFLAKFVNTMAYCNVCTYYHRYNPNSITGNVNVVKEAYSYSRIIKGMCLNIDNFLPGVQKSLILENLITVLNNHYYGSVDKGTGMIDDLMSVCSFSEKFLLKLYLMLNDGVLQCKVLHLLIRIFKIND